MIIPYKVINHQLSQVQCPPRQSFREWDVLQYYLYLAFCQEGNETTGVEEDKKEEEEEEDVEVETCVADSAGSSDQVNSPEKECDVAVEDEKEGNQEEEENSVPNAVSDDTNDAGRNYTEPEDVDESASPVMSPSQVISTTLAQSQDVSATPVIVQEASNAIDVLESVDGPQRESTTSSEEAETIIEKLVCNVSLFTSIVYLLAA